MAWSATHRPWPPCWRTPLGLCFIDGGHGAEPAWADYRGWAPHGGLGGLAGHPRRVRGPGRRRPPPYELWCDAVASGQWVEDGECGSLRVLRRLDDEQVDTAS